MKSTKKETSKFDQTVHLCKMHVKIRWRKRYKSIKAQAGSPLIAYWRPEAKTWPLTDAQGAGDS